MNNSLRYTFRHGISQFFFSNIVHIDICLMMFWVVKLHDFSRNNWFQSIVIVSQIWKCMLSLGCCRRGCHGSEQRPQGQLTNWQHFCNQDFAKIKSLKLSLSYFSEMAVRSSKTDMFVYFLLKLRHWVVDYNDNISSIDGISDEN